MAERYLIYDPAIRCWLSRDEGEVWTSAHAEARPFPDYKSAETLRLTLANARRLYVARGYEFANAALRPPT